MNAPCTGELLECASFLNTMAGECCAECGLQRVPKEYADYLVEQGYYELDSKVPEKPLTKPKCKHKI